MSQTVRYVAKHPFSGDVRQSQLSFTKGSVIVAKPNQSGAWWWGSFNGKEGWFPPAYVTQQQQQPATAFGGQQQQQVSMQQRMQQASFAPAKQQARPAMQQQAFGQTAAQSPMAFGQMPQQQSGFGAKQDPFGVKQDPFQGMTASSLAAADPFAGLQNMNSPSPAAAPAAAPTSSTNSAFPSQNTFSTGNQTSLPSPISAAFAPQNEKATLSTPMTGVQSPTSLPSSNFAAAPSPATTIGYGAPQAQTNANVPRPQPSIQQGPTASPSSVKPVKSPVIAPVKSPVIAPVKSPAMSPARTPVKSPVIAPVKSPVRSPGASPSQPSKADKELDRLKDAMRKEQEELAREREKMTSGIGSSGVEMGLGLAGLAGSGGPVGEPKFNPYDFLANTKGKLPQRKFSPIFRVPPFAGLMDLENYVRRFPLSAEQLADRAGNYQQLAKALSFLCHVVTESGRGRRKGRPEGPLASLRQNHLGCEVCIKLMSVLPHSAGASGKTLDGLFINFINVFVPLIEKLEPNQQLVLPGGWQQPDSFHLCLYIVRNCGGDKFSFTVCNTGKDGLEYHPSTFDSDTGKELKQLALTVWNIPSNRLFDSTFWTILFRMQVYPSKRNNAFFLYTKLLPALNSQPLRSNFDQGPADYWAVPDKLSAASYHPLAKLALTTTPQVGARTSKYSTLMLMNTVVELAFSEIELAPASSMDPEDTRILKLTGRNLANYASTLNASTAGDGTLGATLSRTWDLLDRLHRKINFTSAKPMDQYSHGLSKAALSDDFSKGLIKSMRAEAGSAAFPLFGRLRRDDYENVVKKLMGDPRPDPILIPPVLTDENLAPVATDFMTAASGLQRIADACSLLLQQRRLIKNAPAFAASAAQYAMTVVLPMPNSDPKYCFWRKTPMRRETQVNLLFLIRRICRIYSASTACVQQSRGLVAIKSISFAAVACVADAICRVKAVDDPSVFALHYSGMCEGPTKPFAIEAGSFDTLGSNLPIYDPNLCSLRFRCLDYLRETTFTKSGMKRDTIFNFDSSLMPMGGDLVLINQLSIQLALVRPYPPTDEAMMNHSAKVISGRNGSIIEVLPEFEYFRDIVFHFKHAVSGEAPTAEVKDSKKNRAWVPAHATLHWSVKKKDKEDPTLLYHVTAFDDHPQEFVDFVAQAPKFESKYRGFLSLFRSKQKAVRARLSSADPTTVVNSCGDKFISKKSKNVSVRTEDDVLHLDNKELPTFGHVLSPADAERFIQFLTVPYIRIPLILDFFANGDPGRLTALKAKSLQMIVDAALFEPGRWKPADFTDAITEIPVKDFDRLESLLATAHGTLFNEIAKSPDVLTACIVKMLERALDMDVGRYTRKSSSGPLILYTLRLAVRVEGYMKYAIKKCVPGQPRPRGLESLDKLRVEASLKKLRALLDSQAIPTLEYWVDPSRNKDVDVACRVHAHLLYLFKNYDYKDLDYRAVSIIMSSQVYLTINLRFSSQVYDDLQDTSKPTHPPPSIQIAQSEIFDIIQGHRHNILKFFKENKADGDLAMEAVVRIATGMGSRDSKDAEFKQRHWQSIGHPTCYGRFVPDTEDIKLRDGSYRIPRPNQSYEEWMLHVTTKAVGIEVNVQLSDFTLQNHKMTLLDQNILEDEDFKQVHSLAMGNATDVACAEVMHTSNRYWWRLVGRRYDVQSWGPDQRNYHDLKGFMHPKHSRKFPNGLRGGEMWMSDILKDKANLILPNVKLYLSNKNYSDEPFAILTGWIENKKESDSVCTHTLKEVVVWQHPPAIKVFNVVEHGRRHFRVLEYASDLSTSLHEVENGEPYPDRVGGILAMSAGVPMTTVGSSPSLIVTRALNSELGTQTFIPERFLAGLIPSALIDVYMFWQGKNDEIIGYEKPKVRGEDDEDEEEAQDGESAPSTRLKIKLSKDPGLDTTGFCNTEAEAVIQRVPVLNSNQLTEDRDQNRPILTLLNVQTAPPSSLLKRVGMLLSKLDNLAHVLVWSTSQVSSAHSAATIDFIELPRVNLSFKAKEFEHSDGKKEWRLYSNDYDGLYIAVSTEAREIADKLLGSISHFIVLQNAENDLFVLMPGCALPRRLNTDGTRLSVQVLLDRRNQEWIDNIGEVRCYLYPIHNSRSFLVTPSLASSLYLMVMYFITGAYQEVFKMVESCVSEELSAEEQQIFNQLEFLGNDYHPDAHACRLKLSIVTVGLGEESTMNCPWSVQEEMEEYAKKHVFVSSACRLTTEEELLLLQLCEPTARGRLSLSLLNRKAFVTAVSSLASLPKGKKMTVKLGTERPPTFDNFDMGLDTTIIDNPRRTMISAKLFGAAYSRPEEVRYRKEKMRLYLLPIFMISYRVSLF